MQTIGDLAVKVSELAFDNVQISWRIVFFNNLGTIIEHHQNLNHLQDYSLYARMYT